MFLRSTAIEASEQEAREDVLKDLSAVHLAILKAIEALGSLDLVAIRKKQLKIPISATLILMFTAAIAAIGYGISKTATNLSSTEQVDAEYIGVGVGGFIGLLLGLGTAGEASSSILNRFNPSIEQWADRHLPLELEKIHNQVLERTEPYLQTYFKIPESIIPTDEPEEHHDIEAPAASSAAPTTSLIGHETPIIRLIAYYRDLLNVVKSIRPDNETLLNHLAGEKQRPAEESVAPADSHLEGYKRLTA